MFDGLKSVIVAPGVEVPVYVGALLVVCIADCTGIRHYRSCQTGSDAVVPASHIGGAR